MEGRRKLLLRPQEAAELLSVGRSTIYELIARGIVPSVKLGNILRVPTEALSTLLGEHGALDETIKKLR